MISAAGSQHRTVSTECQRIRGAGVPDERLGEEIKAFVVLKPGAAITADALIAWSKVELAAFKYPRTIELRESLPIGPTGKVFKRALKSL